MPFQPAPSCAEAVIRCTYAGKQVVNVFNFFFPGGYNQTNIDALGLAVDGVVSADYLPNLSTSLHYDETFIRGLGSEADYSALVNTGAGYGTAGGVTLPANVTLAIKLTTGFTGRSQRGRFYSLPTDDDALDGPNVFKAAFAGQMVAMAESLQLTAASSGWNLIVLSRFTAGARRSVAAHKFVTGVTYTDLRADSQRGRLK